VLGVEGDFLPVGDSVAFQNKIIRSSAPKAMIYTAEQKLDARYVPVNESIVSQSATIRTAPPISRS